MIGGFELMSGHNFKMKVQKSPYYSAVAGAFDETRGLLIKLRLQSPELLHRN